MSLAANEAKPTGYSQTARSPAGARRSSAHLSSSGGRQSYFATARFGRSVRHLADSEYSLILAAGFATGIDKRERFGIRAGVRRDPGLLELVDRRIIERLSRRPFRDRVFSTGIKRAYDNTCAISGLRIINGGGRAEAQAAHIRPVHANSGDQARNPGPTTRLEG